MAIFEVVVFCGKCQGTGSTSSQHGGSATCSLCSGAGKFPIGEVDLSDIQNKQEDIIDKCNDILEALTP